MQPQPINLNDKQCIGDLSAATIPTIPLHRCPRDISQHFFSNPGHGQAKSVKDSELNKWNQVAQDVGSSSRRVKGCILYVFGLWRNAEDEPTDKQIGSLYLISSPKIPFNLIGASIGLFLNCQFFFNVFFRYNRAVFCDSFLGLFEDGIMDSLFYIYQFSNRLLDSIFRIFGTIDLKTSAQG